LLLAVIFYVYFTGSMNVTNRRNKREAGAQRQFVELMIVADSSEVSMHSE